MIFRQPTPDIQINAHAKLALDLLYAMYEETQMANLKLQVQALSKIRLSSVTDQVYLCQMLLLAMNFPVRKFILVVKP